MKVPATTKGVMRYCLPHVSGKIIDVGAGTEKYRGILLEKGESYTSFDMENADVVGDAHDLPFSEEFDTAVCNQVLEHVKEPWIVIEQMHKALKKGGILIITAPFLIPFHADPDDYFRYTHRGLRHLCERVGFTVIEQKKYGAFPLILSEFFKFKFCNPYKHKRGFVARNLLRITQKAGVIPINQDTDFYAQNLMICQK